MADAFRAWTLAEAPASPASPASPAPEAMFDALLASARFEELGKGRRGTVLVKVRDDGAVPIVRTTTQYRAAAQRFAELHVRLAEEIQRSGSLPYAFNNALIEHYTHAYATMKRHSDQALDLADSSSIAIYSCYRDPQRPSRRLIVTPKEPGGESFDILLEHGGVVAFSLETNRRFTHTIALDKGAPEDDWLGLTFRTSKSFVRFVDGEPLLANGERLTLATDEQRRNFFQMRRRENDETDFEYPAIAYTISESDLMNPE